jgi:predicted ABC-class ATPase
MTDLKSSTQSKGEVVTQIITSITGVKKTIKGVLTKTIEQGQFTKFETQDGRLVMVNDPNVFVVEVF